MLMSSVLSALVYALVSFLITVANKIVLTSYKFSFHQALAVCQLFVTIVVLQMGRCAGVISFKELSFQKFWRLKTLIVFNFGNLLFGLGGTKSLSLPMFTVLRRFAILLTLYGEIYILKMKKPVRIQVLVYLMVTGAAIAALSDLSFNVFGYTYLALNDIFTAANGIYTKKFMDQSNNENEILICTSLFSIVPMAMLSYQTGEFKQIQQFDGWSNFGFWFFFIVSSTLGFLLNYSAIMCTKHNSPLVTSVIGCLKNIFVTYVGMFIGGDYHFSLLNFFGLSISSAASILFTLYSLMPAKTSEQLETKPSVVNTSSKTPV